MRIGNKFFFISTLCFVLWASINAEAQTVLTTDNILNNEITLIINDEFQTVLWKTRN